MRPCSLRNLSAARCLVQIACRRGCVGRSLTVRDAALRCSRFQVDRSLMQQVIQYLSEIAFRIGCALRVRTDRTQKARMIRRHSAWIVGNEHDDQTPPITHVQLHIHKRKIPIAQCAANPLQ